MSLCHGLLRMRFGGKENSEENGDGDESIHRKHIQRISFEHLFRTKFPCTVCVCASANAWALNASHAEMLWAAVIDVLSLHFYIPFLSFPFVRVTAPPCVCVCLCVAFISCERLAHFLFGARWSHWNRFDKCKFSTVSPEQIIIIHQRHETLWITMSMTDEVIVYLCVMEPNDVNVCHHHRINRGKLICCGGIGWVKNENGTYLFDVSNRVHFDRWALRLVADRMPGTSSCHGWRCPMPTHSHSVLLLRPIFPPSHCRCHAHGLCTSTAKSKRENNSVTQMRC